MPTINCFNVTVINLNVNLHDLQKREIARLFPSLAVKCTTTMIYNCARVGFNNLIFVEIRS